MKVDVMSNVEKFEELLQAKVKELAESPASRDCKQAGIASTRESPPLLDVDDVRLSQCSGDTQYGRPCQTKGIDVNCDVQ